MILYFHIYYMLLFMTARLLSPLIRYKPKSTYFKLVYKYTYLIRQERFYLHICIHVQPFMIRKRDDDDRFFCHVNVTRRSLSLQERFDSNNH